MPSKITLSGPKMIEMKGVSVSLHVGMFVNTFVWVYTNLLWIELCVYVWKCFQSAYVCNFIVWGHKSTILWMCVCVCVKWFACEGRSNVGMFTSLSRRTHMYSLGSKRLLLPRCIKKSIMMSLYYKIKHLLRLI